MTRIDSSEPTPTSRNLEERLMVRFPGAYRALAALGQRLLQPRSRLRRAMLRRQIVSAYAAANRRDFELMLVRYAPDFEFEYDPDFEALGLGGTYVGHDGMRRFLEVWGEAWERWEVQPVLILNLGERFVALGRVRFPGTASGLDLAREFAQLLTTRGGLVVHERDFLAWEKGLRAAGFAPGAIALPPRAEADETEAVRTPLGPDARLRTHRSLDERLSVSWPRAYATLARAVWRLPPRSRLRRALLRRIALSGWSAWARGDLDVMLVRYAPDCLFESPPEYVEVGMRSAYSGHAGAREQATDLRDAFEVMDITPLEIFDAGNRVAILGHVHIRARGRAWSGTPRSE